MMAIKSTKKSYQVNNSICVSQRNLYYHQCRTHFLVSWVRTAYRHNTTIILAMGIGKILWLTSFVDYLSTISCTHLELFELDSELSET